MLYLITGPMFSGKTSELLRIINNLIKQGENVLKVSHCIDKRYNENEVNKIISHNKDQIDCVSLSNLNDIFELTTFKLADYVCIDEAQFFYDCKNAVTKILEHNKSVIVCGLNTNFRREPIKNIHELFPICSRFKLLNAKCYFCDKDAFFTMKKNKSTNEIEVGNYDKYIPVCDVHHSINN